MDALRLVGAGANGPNPEEIERLLMCPICLEVYSKPVVILPCQHNLCRKCANDVFQNRGTPMGSGGRFRCPTCRYEVVLDRHGVYGLQRNLLVENIIDMYQTEGRKPVFQKNEVVMCDEHEEEKVNIYCLTCQKPTCSLCKVFGGHQTCVVSPMDKVYKDQKAEISDSIALMAAGNDRLQAIISQTEEIGKVVECNGRKAKSDLCSAFDSLYSVLEQRKNDMMCRITSDVQERSQVVQEMLKAYGKQLEQASKLMEASLGLIEERSAPVFLTQARETITNIQTTARASEVRKPPFNIQDMTEFSVDFNQQETLLYKLDFATLQIADENDDVINEENATDQSKPATSNTRDNQEDESEEEYDVTAEDDVGDSDATSVTSRSDVGSSYSGARSSIDASGRSQSPSGSRDQSVTSRNRLQSPLEGAAESNEAKEEPPVIKKGRWYDMYVRQLPIDLTSRSTTASNPPMLRSELQLVLPEPSKAGSDICESAVCDAKKDDQNNKPDCDEYKESLPARRNLYRRGRHLATRCVSPDEYEEPMNRCTSDDSESETTLSRPSMYAQLSPRGSFDSSPHTSPTLRRRAQGSSPTRRRPRLYGSHRRRTWSHLLDKK